MKSQGGYTAGPRLLKAIIGGCILFNQIDTIYYLHKYNLFIYFLILMV